MGVQQTSFCRPSSVICSIREFINYLFDYIDLKRDMYKLLILSVFLCDWGINMLCAQNATQGKELLQASGGIDTGSGGWNWCRFA